MSEPGRISRMFDEAVEMPTGMAKHEALERVARAADSAGEQGLAVSARIAMIDSCYYLNRYDLLLAPMAWCRTAEQRDASLFSEAEMHGFNWAHKWVPAGLRRDPRFSLVQIEAMIDELETRYKRLGFSLQPVWGQRVALAAHIGDLDAAEEHFTRFIGTERDKMSDCAGCVVERQVGYLVLRGRYEEAVQHAEPALSGRFTCSTQPQGVLTTLVPAFVALGQLDQAANAHLTAYRWSRNQPQAAISDHLEFCATSGNASRGIELLRRHADQIHQATSPYTAMKFAASAALVLSRADSDAQQIAVPMPGGNTENVPVRELRDQLRSTALRLAAEFDQRNGTSAQGDWIRKTLDRPEGVHVPLAVPAAAPAPQAETVTADPVELAYQVHLAYEENDFLTGYRLLRSLPADLDPLLPVKLAAQIAARRIVAGDPPNALDELALAVQRLVEVGDLDQAARFHARLGMLRAEQGDLAAGIETVRQAMVSAEEHSTSTGRILVRLILAELLDNQHEHEQAGELLAEAERLATETAPERHAAVILETADHEARQGNLDTAERLVTSMLEQRLKPGDRFHALRTRVALAEIRGDVEGALGTSAELVAFVRDYPGPWRPDVLLHRARIIDNVDRAGEFLRELVDTAAICRSEGSPVEISQACYLLSTGYIAHDRLIEAAEVLEEGLRVLPDGYDAAMLRTRFRLGSVCGDLGEHAEARRHFTAMLDVVADETPGAQAMVWASIGTASHELEEPAEAERCLRRAAELWEQADLPVEACRAWIKTAGAIADHDPDAALVAVERSMALIPDGELADRLTVEALELRAYTYSRQERYAEAAADNLRAVELAAGLGDEEAWQVFLMVRAARMYILMETPAEAERLAKESVTLITDETPTSIIARVLEVLSRALEAQAKSVNHDPVARALTARLKA